MRRLFTIFAVIAAAWLLSGRSGTASNDPPDVQAIIEHAVEAAQRNWAAAPAYEFLETDRDKDGTRTYHVTMLFGSPYQRLVQINGQTLSASQATTEEEKFEHELARRHAESAQQRTTRLRAYGDERERDHVLMSQISSAFEFSLTGTETLDGREVYVLDATPRSGYQPPNAHAEALTGMRGRGWIDVDTYNWVKMSAQVVRPVSIVGILARVEPGTSFELEQMPIEDDIWLLRHVRAESHSRIMLLWNHNTYEDETYSDYRRMTASPEQGLTDR